MAAVGPPVGPDPGAKRPHVCLGSGSRNGNRDAVKLPQEWIGYLLDSFRAAFGDTVTVNQPFAGGYITRSHGRERPWVQIELCRAAFMSNAEKRYGVLQALTDFCQKALT
jgi:N-formylglutamate amidohydrolase